VGLCINSNSKFHCESLALQAKGGGTRTEYPLPENLLLNTHLFTFQKHEKRTSVRFITFILCFSLLFPLFLHILSLSLSLASKLWVPTSRKWLFRNRNLRKHTREPFLLGETRSNARFSKSLWLKSGPWWLGSEERTLKLEAFSAQIPQSQLGATQMPRPVHDQSDCCLKKTYFLKLWFQGLLQPDLIILFV
jgi:hypothetical protein